MNQTDFRPSVRLDSSCDKVTITAPRNTRERAWEILGYFYDEGIFDKTGGVPTQIFLKPHPGYDNDAVFSIAVTAVYLATVNKDLVGMANSRVDMDDLLLSKVAIHHNNRVVMVHLHHLLQATAKEHLQAVVDCPM